MSTPGRYLDELHKGICATPMDVLGRQTDINHSNSDKSDYLIRCFSPSSVRVTLHNTLTGEIWGDMQRLDDSDLFEYRCLPGEQETAVYTVRTTYSSNVVHSRADPYQFGCYTLKQTDIEPLRLYRYFGAHILHHLLSDGTRLSGTLFRVYAPSARAVSVVGDFNQWNGCHHPMASADDGIWRLFIPGVCAGDLYKYAVRDHSQNQVLKADPFGCHAEQAHGFASLVFDHSRYRWHDHSWHQAQASQGEHNSHRPLSIYEVHAGSWKHVQEQGKRRPPDYRQLATMLIPYVLDMGFTHIELMPVLEHPFTASWGYQATGLYAPTSRYGSPDDFKYFVDQCHQQGIGVILDWVPAHFPSDNHGLAKFDGTPLFEDADPRRGWHPDWHTYIYDYSKSFVRHFLISSACYWLDRFHLDGLRVDAVASMLYLDYSRQPDEWTPNQEGGNVNHDAVSFLQQLNSTLYENFPDCIIFAEESTSWPGVTRNVRQGGLGFGYKWNLGWMHDLLRYMKREHVHRRFHHDDLTFSLLYTWSENYILPLSHDEVVHGKGSLLRRMAGDEWQRFANLRAMFGYMYGHPGKKLLFMGSELGSWNEWHHDSDLDWWLLDAGPYHKGLQRLVQDLNRCYRKLPALYQQDHQPGGFRWLVVDDHLQSVHAFLRSGYKEEHQAVVICNMTPVVRNHYRLGIPAGRWQEVLNTDLTQYAGNGVSNPGLLNTEKVSSHGFGHSLCLTLPPLATLILEKHDACS